MADAAAIVEWVKSTVLWPYLDRVPPKMQADFLAGYEERVHRRRLYGDSRRRRLLNFPRPFMVAVRT